MNLEINEQKSVDGIDEIDMRIKELEEIKVDKLNDLNNAEEKLIELKQIRELFMTMVENLKNEPDVKHLYINRNASLGRVNLNLERLKILQQMTVNGMSKVDRKDVSLPYTDDLYAKVVVNTKIVGFAFLVFMAFRKGNFLEKISSLVLSLYLGNKALKSKDYISVNRAFTECERKLSTAREQFYTSECQVTKIEELIDLMNNAYNSDELLCYMDELSKVVFEINELISKIDNEVSVLLEEKMFLEKTSADAEVDNGKVRKIGALKPINVSDNG